MSLFRSGWPHRTIQQIVMRQLRDEHIAPREDTLDLGAITNLDVAFSRDQPEKMYVQHRIAERADALRGWVEDGAHIYVCGDAQRMAKDVERALVEIVQTHGAHTTNEAVAFVADLKKRGRYQTDVY